MAYVKKNLTPEERSAIARANAAKRKKFGGGRPKGSTNGPVAKMSLERKSVQIFDGDLSVFRKLAFAKECSTIDLFHEIAERLKANNPGVFNHSGGVKL